MKTLTNTIFLILISCLFYSLSAQDVDSLIIEDQCFEVPAGVTSITVKAWGGGGAGAKGRGGGGGGGSYATHTFNVTPGQVYQVTIGQGGMSSNDDDIANEPGGKTLITLNNSGMCDDIETLDTIVLAVGGRGADAADVTDEEEGAGGDGGNASDNIPVAGAFSGGNGGMAATMDPTDNPAGGGGGGSATNMAVGGNGGDGSVTTGGLGGVGQGNGGAGGGTVGSNGTDGLPPGGGGGGGAGGTGGEAGDGGNGARGEMRICYDIPIVADPCVALNVEVPLMPIIINKSTGMIIGQTAVPWGDGGSPCGVDFLNLAKFVCPKDKDGKFTLLGNDDEELDGACLNLSVLEPGTYTIEFCTTKACPSPVFQRDQINMREEPEPCCKEFVIVLWDFNVSDPCSCDDPLNMQLPGEPVTRFHDRLVLKTTDVVGFPDIMSVCITSVDGGLIYDGVGTEIKSDAAFTEDIENKNCWYLDFWIEPGEGATVTYQIKFEDTSSDDFINGTFEIEPCIDVCPDIPIPAMGTWALIILGMMMTIFSIAYIRKRKPGMV